jgi:hypothetical protein
MKKFDSEYSTQYVKEMQYLLQNNIKYTFVKDIDGITTYKYKKLQNYLEFWRFFIPNFKNENNRVIIKGDIK